jgi:tripartite-type tricarboxylate transporter receptor subunit TctC
MRNRRKSLSAAIGLIAAGGAAQRARTQTVDKVVHIIVGFPVGGGTDIVARVLSRALGGVYAASIIVENKPGASARLAVEYVKDASKLANRRHARSVHNRGDPNSHHHSSGAV